MKTTELSDGWSFVTRSKARRPKNRPHVASAKKDVILNAPTDQKSVDSAIKRIEGLSKVFKDTGCAELLRIVLAKQAITVQEAFCAGLSSLLQSIDFDTRRSQLQLCVYLWVTDQLSQTGYRFKMGACDPVFTATDSAILKHFNIETENKQAAGSKSLVPASFFFAPFLPWSVLVNDYLDSARPQICICQDLVATKDNLELIQESGIRVETETDLQDDRAQCAEKTCRAAISNIDAFLQDYSTFNFPDCNLHPTALQGLKIYILRDISDTTR